MCALQDLIAGVTQAAKAAQAQPEPYWGLDPEGHSSFQAAPAAAPVEPAFEPCFICEEGVSPNLLHRWQDLTIVWLRAGAIPNEGGMTDG